MCCFSHGYISCVLVSWIIWLVVTFLWAAVSGPQLLAVVRGFLLSKICGLSLVPTWSPVESVLGVLLQKVKQVGR
jgi:hypothetical protein